MSPVEAFNDAIDTYADKLTRVRGPKPQKTDDLKQPQQKRATNVQKNVDAARKQPPTLDDAVGADSDKSGLQSVVPDINKLSDEELSKLPKETLRRMRGDFISH
jgi:hypothetical protein